MATRRSPRPVGGGIVLAAAVGREKPLMKSETIDPGAAAGRKLAPSTRAPICCGDTVTVICWLAVFPWVLDAVASSTCWPTDAAAAFQANVYGETVRLVRRFPSSERSILEMPFWSRASTEMLTVPPTFTPSVGDSKARVGESTPGIKMRSWTDSVVIPTFVTENRLA